jgi:hypothetical protein
MKVTVSSGAADPCGGRRELAFIFGVGPEGLVPFELTLSGRAVGEEVRFTVAAGDAGRFFGHLAPAALRLFDRDAEVLAARIEAVERPDPREVVRALAETAGHGSCDCGCGCGR